RYGIYNSTLKTCPRKTKQRLPYIMTRRVLAQGPPRLPSTGIAPHIVPAYPSVDDGEQGVPAVRRQGQPAMATAVEVQQLAVTRARLAAAAMPAAGLVGGTRPAICRAFFTKA